MAQSDTTQLKKHVAVRRSDVGVAGFEFVVLLAEARRKILTMQDVREVGVVGPTWTTTNTAAVQGTGGAETMRWRGSRHPFEPPITTIATMTSLTEVKLVLSAPDDRPRARCPRLCRWGLLRIRAVRQAILA
jgi:hypothetical protein